MTINLRVIKEKTSGPKISDISDGFFLLNGNDVWAIKINPSKSSSFYLVNLNTFEVLDNVKREELKHTFSGWDEMKILSPKQVNLNIGFQWRE
ncbi:hypothetical protein ABEO51_07895 [Bacillus safensis]